jgi:hypothetical protein
MIQIPVLDSTQINSLVGWYNPYSMEIDSDLKSNAIRSELRPKSTCRSNKIGKQTKIPLQIDLIPDFSSSQTCWPIKSNDFLPVLLGSPGANNTGTYPVDRYGRMLAWGDTMGLDGLMEIGPVMAGRGRQRRTKLIPGVGRARDSGFHVSLATYYTQCLWLSEDITLFFFLFLTSAVGYGDK